MNGDHLATGTRNVTVADSWGGAITDDEAFNGFLRQEITFNGAGGAEVTSTLNDPWKAGPTATRTRNGVTTNAWITRTGSTRTRTALSTGGFRTTAAVNSYNGDGQIVTAEDRGDEAVTGDETCRRTTYARNNSTWMIDRVSQDELTSGTCAAAVTPSTVLSRTRSFYDTYVDGSSFGAAPTAGNVVRTEVLDSWNGTTPVYVATASSKYDTSGRVTDVTDARGYTKKIGYATVNGGQVTQIVETNALGHQTTTTREPAWGLPTKVTDPNGAVTELTYDGLGRLLNVWLPGRAKATQTPSMKYTYNKRSSGDPTTVTTESLLPTGSAYKKSIDLFDGFLRQRQNQTQATGGGRVITDTFYNTTGQTAWTSQPYYDTTNTPPGTSLGIPQGQIPAVTEHGYDGAGRETTQIFKALGVEKWRSTTAYGGDRIHVTPPNGGTATTTINDAHGNTIELRQYKNPADVASTDPAKFDKTTYTYDLLNHLKTVKDQPGNTWSYSYDLRGRQIQLVDPDTSAGTGTTTTYTATGQVETVTGPVGSGTATVAYTYDELDRKTSLRDDSTTGPVRAAWTYDTVPNGKGKPATATRYVNGNAYTTKTDAYDPYGRPTSTSVVLPASESNLCVSATPTPCTYTTARTYKANGQLSQITMPTAADLASEKLTLGYNDVGQQTSILSASQIYLSSVTYDKLGQLTQRQLGEYGYRVAITSTFDEPTRRLTSENVVPELKPEAANYTYTYDNAGNIKSIADKPAGQTADAQCFTYDYLRRLTDAWTPGSGNCSTAPSTAGLGGPAPYWHTWTFDATGNRKSEVRHAATGDTTYTYTYPTAGSARPHAVSNVTATGATTYSRNYTYDQGGNTQTRPTATGATQTLTYDREGHLSTLVEGTTTSYIYDADGNRLIGIDAKGRTLYLGGTEVRYDSATAAKKGTRYYAHNGATIAVRTATTLNWIISDHHATPGLTVDAATLATAKQRTLPYGEKRGSTGSTWPAALNRGFVGGTDDATGLTHLGAREYDPILDTADPVQMNGYTYANNNPTTASDPSGLVVCPDGDCRTNPNAPSMPSSQPWLGTYLEGQTGNREPQGGCPTTSCMLSTNGGNGKTRAQPTPIPTVDRGAACGLPGHCGNGGGRTHSPAVTAKEMMTAFAAGLGGTYYFQDGDYFTEEFKRSARVSNLRYRIAYQIAIGNSESAQSECFCLEGIDGVDAIDDIYTYLLNFSRPGFDDAHNLASSYVGGFQYTYKALGQNSDGTVNVQVHIVNHATVQSGTRPPGGSDHSSCPACKFIHLTPQTHDITMTLVVDPRQNFDPGVVPGL